MVRRVLKGYINIIRNTVSIIKQRSGAFIYLNKTQVQHKCINNTREAQTGAKMRLKKAPEYFFM